MSSASSLLPGIALSLVSILALAAAAAPLAWRFRLRQPRLDVLAWAFLTLHLLTTLSLVHGIAGWLRPAPLLASSLTAGALGAAWIAWSPGLRDSIAGAAKDVLRAVRGRPRLAALLAFVMLLQLAREAAHVLLLPPYVWDTLTYHLPRLPEWIQAGGFATIETPSLRMHWPANHELLQLWLALFPHHDAVVEAAGVPFHALAAGSVYASARSLTAGRRTATLAALAYACSPAVALQATSAKNDLPIAATFLFCTALLLDLRARRVSPLRHLGWMALVLVLALGTKPYVVFLLPGLVVLGGTVPWPRFRSLWRGAERAPRRRPLLAATGLASALLVGFFWYGRNYTRFGDPFYPTNLRLFGELIFEGERGRAQQGSASLTGLGRNLRMTFRRKVLDDRGPFTAELKDMAGWGWFAFALGPPALLYGALKRPALAWVAAAFVASLLALFAMVTPDPWNLRFTVWFPALAALSMAVAVETMVPGGARRALVAVAGAAIVLDVVGSLGGSHQDPRVWRTMAALPLRERSSAELGRVVPNIGPGFAEALAAVPRGVAIGYHTYKDGGIYPLYDADYGRRLVFVPIEADDDVPGTMRARAVTHLLVTRERALVRELLDAAVADGRLRRIGEGLYALAG